MPSQTDHSPTTRAAYLDLLKSLLVVGMIGAHVVQLITFRAKPEAAAFAEYANVVSFSGFMFAFGIGLGLPKGDRKPNHLWRRLRPLAILLLAVYLSSFAFALLVDRKPITLGLVLDVATMRRLFGWSEFLATFFALALLIQVARPVLLTVGRNPWLLLAVSVACLAGTFYATGAIVPMLGTVVSHTAFANFPLLCYLPWFLLGIWYASRPVRLWHFIPALAITGYLCWFTWQTGQLPQRFPPTILWIAGPAAVLLAYLAATRAIAARIAIPSPLLVPGRHVLSVVVISNIALFATRRFMGMPVKTTLLAAGVAVGILVVLTVCWMVVERLGNGTSRRLSLAKT